jgi:hypothetical protein
MLWKGHQLAIGELMTVSRLDATGNAELFSMGYAEFTRKWKAGEVAAKRQRAHSDEGKDRASQALDNDSQVFRGWFGYIERGIYEVDRQEQHGHSTGLNRIRRLQHLLLELIDALDPDGARARESKPVPAAHNCACTRCQTAKSNSPNGNV